jgi:flagellar protein FliS
MQKSKYHAYANATQTVAKTQQIVMLYDGAIRFLRQAREAIKDHRIEDRYHLLSKASQVVNGLQSCLDFEKGGDVARVLYSFYASVDGRIFSIHRTNSIETCDEVIADVKQMRDVWHDIDNSSADKPAASEAPMSHEAMPMNVTISA